MPRHFGMMTAAVCSSTSAVDALQRTQSSVGTFAFLVVILHLFLEASFGLVAYLNFSIGFGCRALGLQQVCGRGGVLHVLFRRWWREYLCAWGS